MVTTNATRILDHDALEDVALGAAVLGTGGGGDPYIGKLIAQSAIAQYGPVPLIDPDALADDDVVVSVNMSGSPIVMTEKIPNGRELEVVYDRAVEFAGRQPAAVLPIEVGGINSCFPIAAAARARLPLIDADGMGRAFPEFQMTSLNVGGVRFGPRFVGDEKGNVLRIEGINARWIERINRNALVAMGGSVITAICLTGADVKRAALRHSITLALEIGASLRRAHAEKRDWRDLLYPVCGAIPLYQGKVTSVERRTTGGFARGHALLLPFDSGGDEQLRLDFQNEHLLARVVSTQGAETILASTPDLIIVLDSETGTPVTTEGLRYGQRVDVLGIPCQPLWRTPRGLEIAGPRYFGWEIDYAPLEERTTLR